MQTSAIEDCAKDSTVPSNVSSKQSNEEVRPPLVQIQQESLHRSFPTQNLEDAQILVAKVVFFSKSALALVDNNHWKHAWKKIGKYNPSFTGPLYHTIQNEPLDKCFVEVKVRVAKTILCNILYSRCTIVSDGLFVLYRQCLADDKVNLVLLSVSRI